MPKRLPYEALILTALLLGSCGEQHVPKSERIELADTNARKALARVSALENRVDELERRLKK
jgi:hypothetical protein